MIKSISFPNILQYLFTKYLAFISNFKNDKKQLNLDRNVIVFNKPNQKFGEY